MSDGSVVIGVAAVAAAVGLGVASQRVGSRDLGRVKERAAEVLGWSMQDVNSMSFASLRELVRPVDPDLAAEISRVIQSEEYVSMPRGRRRRRGSQALDAGKNGPVYRALESVAYGWNPMDARLDALDWAAVKKAVDEKHPRYDWVREKDLLSVAKYADWMTAAIDWHFRSDSTFDWRKHPEPSDTALVVNFVRQAGVERDLRSYFG